MDIYTHFIISNVNCLLNKRKYVPFLWKYKIARLSLFFCLFSHSSRLKHSTTITWGIERTSLFANWIISKTISLVREHAKSFLYIFLMAHWSSLFECCFEGDARTGRVRSRKKKKNRNHWTGLTTTTTVQTKASVFFSFSFVVLVTTTTMKIEEGEWEENLKKTGQKRQRIIIFNFIPCGWDKIFTPKKIVIREISLTKRLEGEEYSW